MGVAGLRPAGEPKAMNPHPQGSAGSHKAMRFALLAIVALLTLVGVTYSPEPLVVGAAGGTLLVILAVMWSSDGPSVFLLPCAFQWSEVAVKPILTATQQRPLSDFSTFGFDLEPAVLFGFAGVLALTLGLRAGFGNNFSGTLRALRVFVSSHQPRAIIALSIVLILFGMGAEAAERFSGPARQIVISLAGTKLAGVFLLVFWSLHMRQGYVWPLLIVTSQIVVGMTGFFAGFRDTILVTGIATLCARPGFRAGSFLLTVAAGLLVVSVAVFWSAYKPIYRDWVNDGTGAQVVMRPMDERIGFLLNYAGSFDAEKYAEGADRLLMRHSYVDFLAGTLQTVPASIPHEGGARLTASVLHVFTPRVLFPDKPVLEDDSAVTAKYSGAPVAVDGLTSISIGYLGELYIDFGAPGAVLAAALIGFVIALILNLSFQGAGRSTPLLAPSQMIVIGGLCAFGTALIKMMGAVIMGVIIVILFAKVILPRLMLVADKFAPTRRRRSLLYLPSP